MEFRRLSFGSSWSHDFWETLLRFPYHPEGTPILGAAILLPMVRLRLGETGLPAPCPRESLGSMCCIWMLASSQTEKDYRECSLSAPEHCAHELHLVPPPARQCSALGFPHLKDASWKQSRWQCPPLPVTSIFSIRFPVIHFWGEPRTNHY